MKVPHLIWAGVIQVFWILLSLGAALAYSVMALLSVLATGAAGIFGQPAIAERSAVWLVLSCFVYLAQLSFQVPIAFAFFAMKRWGYGLYLWSIGPLTLVGLALRFGAPSVPELDQRLPLSLSILSTIGWILALGLVALQVFLVIKSKDELVG